MYEFNNRVDIAIDSIELFPANYQRKISFVVNLKEIDDDKLLSKLVNIALSSEKKDRIISEDKKPIYLKNKQFIRKVDIYINKGILCPLKFEKCISFSTNIINISDNEELKKIITPVLLITSFPVVEDLKMF